MSAVGLAAALGSPETSEQNGQITALWQQADFEAAKPAEPRPKDGFHVHQTFPEIEAMT